jgi:glycosyltransferase A (GT-A) superfamily protein (DUF2064 family)
MTYPNGATCVYKIKGAEMGDELLKTIENMNNENGKLLLYIYEEMPELWQAYARASYERLLQRKIKNLGKQGAAELAVKLSEFLSSKVTVNESV